MASGRATPAARAEEATRRMKPWCRIGGTACWEAEEVREGKGKKAHLHTGERFNYFFFLPSLSVPAPRGHVVGIRGSWLQRIGIATHKLLWNEHVSTEIQCSDEKSWWCWLQSTTRAWRCRKADRSTLSHHMSRDRQPCFPPTVAPCLGF